ncbi:MAG: hypothetical protein ACOYXY_20930 [Thermodesulfobacteriota bacterium]
MKIPRSLVITKWWPAVVPVLGLLLLDHGFGSEDGYDPWRVPPGQPAQMRTQLGYERKLTDTWFDSDAWGYPYERQVAAGGKTSEGEDPSLLKHTANCRSTSLGTEHPVEFCEARLVDRNTIDFLFHHDCPGFNDKLRVQVKSGMFTCQYWTFYKGPMERADFIWTTNRQKLTLDKQVFRKGDVIKGRIDFECLQEATHPKFLEKWGKWPKTIKVYGVFKTIVE